VPGSKRGNRLVKGCRTLRELLSTIPEARTTVENLCAETDVPLALTRTELAAVCSAPLKKISALVQSALAQAGPQVSHTLVVVVHSELIASSTVCAAQAGVHTAVSCKAASEHSHVLLTCYKTVQFKGR
jgi:molecular chaperone DnaK (HSP70)